MSVEATFGKSLISRRTALAAAAGVGVTVVTASANHVASASDSRSSDSRSSGNRSSENPSSGNSGAGSTGVAESHSPSTGPVVVRVRDLASGRLDVFTGSGYVQVQDKDLAARLLRAARA